MTRAYRTIAALLALVVLGGVRYPAAAQAAQEVATIAAVVGGAELQRAGGGGWQLAVVGSALFAGDRVRTRPASRAKLVFQDDSVVDIGPATEIRIGKQVFNPTAHKYASAVSLVTGKIRALVSEYYSTPGAHYEIETPTAVAGVRGTEFVVLYDANADYTDVVGVENQVRVEGTLGVVGGGVRVGPQMATRVQRGRFPSVPRRIDADLFRQYLEGLEITGTGGRDSLGSSSPVVRGALLSPSDSADKVAAESPKQETAAPKAAGGIAVGVPGETLAQQISPDVRSNTQPLVDFRLNPPGQPVQPPSGNGAVKVQF
jgi:FecR protein